MKNILIASATATMLMFGVVGIASASPANGSCKDHSCNATSNAKVKNSGNSSSRSNVRNSGNSSSRSNVRNSGNSSNRNVNKQAQGQLQGQLQGQKQKAVAKQGQGQGQGQSMAFTDNSTYEATASSATAAALTASSGTCMGSSSAGAQGMSFGVSLGSTWNDSNCDLRKFAAMFVGMGNTPVAMALLCRNDDVAAAMETVGTPCTADVAKKAAAKDAVKNGTDTAWVDPDDTSNEYDVEGD